MSSKGYTHIRARKKDQLVQLKTALDWETYLTVLALSEITASFIGKEASIENLLEIRTQITRLYTSEGYTTSAAFIPSAQDISQGTVQVQVVEGKVSRSGRF